MKKQAEEYRLSLIGGNKTADNADEGGSVTADDKENIFEPMKSRVDDRDRKISGLSEKTVVAN